MKSSFEELLRDLQIISKELFLSSWNLVSTINLNTAFYNTAFGKNTRPFKHRIPLHAGEDPTCAEAPQMCRIPPYAGDNIPFKLNEHSSVGYPRMQGKF